MSSRFVSFPPCCQKVLDELDGYGRKGVRNCAQGHSVSLELAEAVEKEAALKKALSAPPAK